MNVKRAKTAGFCFGVKRAVETVYEQAKNSDAAPIYTYGPIIHNEEVVKDLENQGVIVLRTEQELEQLTEGTVIIRSHGVAKYIYEKLEKKKIQIVDATCPFVKKIHRIVSRESAAGKQIVIIGNPKHPEVQEAIGKIERTVLASDKFLGTVAGDFEAAKKLYERGYTYVVVMSDTTSLGKLALENVQKFRKEYPER